MTLSNQTPTIPAQQRSPAASPATATRPVNASIMVIEDDARSARMISAGLSVDGYRVTVAASGEQLSELLLEATPDLIICDVLLPGIDGIELTRCLRAQPAMQAVPVLLVTSLDDRKVMSRGLEAGADDILIKPIHTLELRTRVAALLRKKVAAEELRARGETAQCFRATAAAPLAGEALQSEPAATPATFDQSTFGTVLLVEDNEAEARLQAAYLVELGCRVLTAVDAQSALQVLENEAVDLGVLDLLLPDCSGYALIEQMRNNPRHAKTPILIVSAMTEARDRVKALEMGADDFIVKGFDSLEFQARVRRLLRLKMALDQLTVDYDQVLRQAITDSLTGLYTHGFLKDTLTRQLECARRYGWPLSLMFLDIDHFKAINDQHGHAVGDEVLRSLGSIIRGTIRHADIGVRYGGEEFVVLMPHTDQSEAMRLAERLRTTVAEKGRLCTAAGGQVNPTVSLGVASFPEHAIDAASLLEHADEAMYKAKRGGRNQAVAYSRAETAPAGQAVVLIADDDPRNVKLLEAYLIADGYHTIRASDGQEAIDIARRERPDLILLDGMMPRLSGFEACQWLKDDFELKLIPVVLVTALNGRDDKLRGIEAGADEFISKPIDKTALLSRLRALLRTKRSTDLLEDAETVIFALAHAVESRDPSTGGHVERVSSYAVAVGKAAGLSESQIEGLRRAGYVHDIGKIAIPDSILLKPGKLTPEERVVIQTHVEVGYELLRPMRTFTESLPAVRFHHERLDGSGYPLGLRGEQVPITAQILAIVDVYDALSSDRVYRKAMSSAESFAILREEASRGLHNSQLIDLLEQVVAKSAPTVANDTTRRQGHRMQVQAV